VAPLHPQIPLALTGADRLSFDLYLPGPNGPLLEHLRQLSGGTASGALYLWGETGVGKTHLLQALCRDASERGRRAGLLPLSARADHGPDIFQALEDLEVACIDDVDELAGDGPWELALFNLFNRLRDTGRTLVLSSRFSPAGSPVQLPDLKSRLGWDLVFHIAPLDDAGRFQALQLRARHRGMDIPDEVLEFLARRIARDMGSLSGWLDRLDRESLAAGKRLTVPFVRELLDRRD
jgi:DnaA-homolog protein